MTWLCKTFDALSLGTLYDCLALRQQVFILEQGCVYLDSDSLDQYSHHILGYQQGILVAYARLVAPGLKYAEPSLGRVLAVANSRGTGVGRQLLEFALHTHDTLYPRQGNRIGAQAYLQSFYSTFGFQQTSDTYIEAGIPHIEMLRAASQ